MHPQVPVSAVLFLIHGIVVGLGLPIVKFLPPEEINDWLGWWVLPFVLLPSIAIFFVRFDRIESAYPYLVAASVLSVLLAIGYKLIVFATGLYSVS